MNRLNVLARRRLSLVVAMAVGALAVRGSRAADVELVPVSASGGHTIAGNEITLDGAGQRVFVEMFISGWDPDQDGVPLLRAYQLGLDASGYTSGVRGSLTPALASCAAPTDCAAAFGGTCSLTGFPCNVDTDCPLPAFGEVCNGPECGYPDPVDPFCVPGFILVDRPDFVFAGEDNLPAVDLTTLNFRFAAASSGLNIADTGVRKYAATLVLDVSADAMGTFVVGLFAPPATLLQDENSNLISPLTITPVRITIPCAVAADCDDGDACTTDVCQANQTCANTPSFDPAVSCCDPATGTLTPLDDDNECTEDTCLADGTPQHTDLPSGAACGDPSQTACDLPDTCNGAGVCLPNNAAPGAACGDPTATECDAPDTCDAAGICQSNFSAIGTTCGDPTATDCTAPDGCDGAGGCAANDAADGTACDDGMLCTTGEACAAGACTGGVPVDCNDGLPCTDDSCDPADGLCDNVIVAGACLINGVCRADGEFDPANDCQACDPAAQPIDWSFRPAGSLCDDGDACTGTGRPGIGVDECDGAGVCSGLVDPDCNDDCAFAVPVTEGANVGNNDNRAIDDAEASCQIDSNNDVWFVYTATCDGTVFGGTTGSQFTPSNDPVLSVYDACPDVGGVEIACDDDSGVDLQAALTFQATAGAQYWLRVAGFENNSGDLVLNIGTVDGCLIDGACFANGMINPANECEACIPAVSTTTWSVRAEGSACGNPVDTLCDSPDACDGAGVCESNPKPDGTPCDDDGNECTFDVCQAGACDHPPVPALVPCGDATDNECDNPDTCDGNSVCQPNFEPAGLACGNPADDQCDHPDRCDGAGLCDTQLEPDGTPCDDADICTGTDACQTGACVGTPIPEAPLVEGVGPRHVAVTPSPAGSVAPVALRMTSPDWPCLMSYVSPAGPLVPDPVFLVPDDWGTVVVGGIEIAPSSTYVVTAECGTFVSSAGSASTSLWGDIVGEFLAGAWTDPNGLVEIEDMLAMVDGFANRPFAPPMGRTDLWPCVPDGIVDIGDIVQVVDAFRGRPYPCTRPCP